MRTKHPDRMVSQGPDFRLIWMFDPIFRVNIDVVIGPSSGEEIDAWLLKHKYITHTSQCGPVVGRSLTIDGGLNIFIFLSGLIVNTAEFHATLAHEAFHAAHMVLSLRGQLNQCDAGEESHAYVIGWIVRETMIGNTLLDRNQITKKPKKP